MRTTIDAGGRVVIPKPIREELGLAPGNAVEVSLRNGRVEIEPTPSPMKLVHRSGALAAEHQGEVTPLTTEQVRETLERVRR